MFLPSSPLADVVANFSFFRSLLQTVPLRLNKHVSPHLRACVSLTQYPWGWLAHSCLSYTVQVDAGQSRTLRYLMVNLWGGNHVLTVML